MPILFWPWEVHRKEFVKRRARAWDEEKTIPPSSDEATRWASRGHAQLFF